MKGSAIRVQIVGPDGAGKSSVVVGTKEVLARTGLRVRHVHFDPSTSYRETVAPAPHSKPARGSLGQVASLARRLLIYWHAAFFGSLSRVGADVVIQERGWHDQIVDPRRYRLADPGKLLAGLASRVAPRYDLRVRLEGDPDAIVARKPELSSAEVNRQLKAWRDLPHAGDQVAIDSVKNPVDVTTDELASSLRRARCSSLEQGLRPVIGVPGRLEMVATPGANTGIKSLYRPYSRLGRLGRRVARRTPLGSPSPFASRVAEVIAELGIPFDSVAAIRSHTRQQAVAAIEIDARLTEFVRIRWGDDADMSSEAQVLHEVGAVEGLRIPRVIATGKVGENSVLRLTAVAGSDSFPIFDAQQALDIAVALRWARGGRGVTHGDFTAWNLLNGAVPGLVDWESASLDYKPGLDLERYLTTRPAGLPAPDHHVLRRRYLERCGLNGIR